MKTFLARQPLFDIHNEVIGYKLLFTKDDSSRKDIEDDYYATLKVIKDLIINFGVSEITNDKRAFIKFNSALILDRVPELFKPEKLVIEMAELDEENKELIARVKEYKDEGYLLSFDYYNGSESNQLLIEMADMIKLDFKKYTKAELEQISSRLRHLNKIILAEKVEDNQMFLFAKKLSVTFFQGYYFQRPTILESKEASSLPTVYLELIQELNQEVLDYDILSATIKKDSAMTLSILKMMDSVVYHTNSKITSVKQALVRLGVKESRRVIMINMLKSIATDDSPMELVNMCLRRGRIAEKIAKYYHLEHRADELFILGLLSMINILMKRPMQSILADVPLKGDLIAALLGENNELSETLEVVILYEMEQYDQVKKRLDGCNCSTEVFTRIYLDASSWADKLI